MSRVSNIAKMIVAVALVQTTIWGAAVCEGELGILLDEGLQRALVLIAIDRNVADVDIEHVLTDARLGTLAIPCEDLVLELSSHVDEEDILPPSVAPRELVNWLENRHHARWYILSAKPGKLRDLADAVLDMEPANNPDGPGRTAVFTYESLGLVLVHARSFRDFAALIDAGGRIRPLISHVMENFPFAPAVSEAKVAVKLTGTSSFAGFTGAAATIAILDTGVEADFFPGDAPDSSRIVYEACFSSRTMLVEPSEGVEGMYTVPTCSGRDDVAETWTPSTVSPEFHAPYVPSSTADGDGGPCVAPTGSSPVVVTEYEEVCIHGTRVAYIAAGSSDAMTVDGDPVPQGVAPAARVISIQVASTAPEGYCSSGKMCAVIMPIDVIRALRHLELLHKAGSPYVPSPAHPLVAANLSFQVARWCDTENRGLPTGDELECGQTERPNEWAVASYGNRCVNPFATRIAALASLGVSTVVAAGNSPPGSDKALGVMSLPACVEKAASVAATDNSLQLWYRTKFSKHTDFAAPGHALNTPVTATADSGTSYAAPMLTGALALIPELVSACEGTVDATLATDPLAWLRMQAQEISRHPQKALPAGASTMVGLSLRGGASCAP